jgi:hypothetical protein
LFDSDGTGPLGTGTLGTLCVGRLITAFGSLPSASAAVVLDIHGYCEGREPVGSVGGGLEFPFGGGKLTDFGKAEVVGEIAKLTGVGALESKA